jgi:ribosomal protein S18 acetylase RimI-like enzyme
MSPAKESKLNFEIMKMSPADVEAATAMRLECWLDTYTNDEIGVTREWVEEHNLAQITPEKNKIRKDRLKDSTHHAGWVAKNSTGEIIGSTTPFIYEDGRQDVGSLYVKREWRGKGVAAALMQKVIDWFDSKKSIELGVANYNERAKSFYRKWGFEEIPSSEELFADKIPNIKMIRKGDSQ